MRQTLGQVQERALVRPTTDGTMPAAPPTVKEIPYDYVARFALQGKRGNRQQDVISVSTDGAFVAVAMGYSFIPALQNPLPPIALTTPVNGNSGGKITLFDVIARRITAEFFELQTSPSADLQETERQLATLIEPLIDPRMVWQCLQVRLCGIDFKYSIIDSGSGRELQNQPIHNIAGLGEPNGNRPFRPMAKPMLFMPRSTIRIEVEEISEGPLYGYDEESSTGQKTGRRIGAELFIVLHGYKMLGYGT